LAWPALLLLLAATLGAYGIYDFVVSADGSLAAGGEGLLRAIGYLVVAIAVFDVSKYLIEEEVVRGVRSTAQPDQVRPHDRHCRLP